MELSNPLDTDMVMGCVCALLDFWKKEQDKKTPKQLINDIEPVQLIITLHSIYHKKRDKPYLIRIPHSLSSDSTDICVFVKDPAKEYKELFREKNVPNVKKVLGIESLKNKYSRYEARRKLLNSYDIFLCDEALSLSLRRYLGKSFFKSKKYPIPIRISSNLCENVARARDSTYLHIGTGSSLNVRIANTEMEEKIIHENIMLSIDQIVRNIPGKWKNIKSLGLRTKDSVCLPFYNNVLFPKTSIPQKIDTEDHSQEELPKENN